MILLNNRLPGAEGLTAPETIRPETGFGRIPVALLTASESGLKEKKAYDPGANAHVVKPMPYGELTRAVRRINDFWELVEVPEDPQ